jgi:hypothetical protein
MHLKISSWLLLLIGCAPFASYSQGEVSTRKLYYFNQNVSGPVIGRNVLEPSFNAVTLHGIRYGKCSIAPGLSYDKYVGIRSFHAVGSGSLDLSRGKRATFFFQGMAGIGSFKLRSEETGFTASNKHAALYQGSLGLRLPSAKWRIYMMAGYRIQRFSYTNTFGWSNGFSESPPFKTDVKQDLRRVVVQLGFGLH